MYVCMYVCMYECMILSLLRLPIQLIYIPIGTTEQPLSAPLRSDHRFPVSRGIPTTLHGQSIHVVEPGTLAELHHEDSGHE